jgi:monovalent cation:H+ antiporter-2, CPA2 family
MLVIGARVLPWVLAQIEATGSRELFTLAVVAIALGIGYGSAELLGLSFALGAFFAGIVLKESQHSRRAARETQPLQDIFVVLFFVSVGMLFDPTVLLREPLHVLEVIAVIVIGKSVTAYAIMRALAQPIGAALTVGVGLGQIGEFSFILVALAQELKILPEHGQSVVLAGGLLSIAINPFLFRLARLATPAAVESASRDVVAETKAPAA